METKLEIERTLVETPQQLKFAEDPSLAWARWTPADVRQWVAETLNLPQHAAAFESNDIDGPMLLELTEDLLEDCLGIRNPIHRKKVLAHAKLLPILPGLRAPAHSPPLPGSPLAPEAEPLSPGVLPSGWGGEECETSALMANAPLDPLDVGAEVGAAPEPPADDLPCSPKPRHAPRRPTRRSTLGAKSTTTVHEGGGAMAMRAATRSMGQPTLLRSATELSVTLAASLSPRGGSVASMAGRGKVAVATTLGPSWGELSPSASTKGSFPAPYVRKAPLRDTHGGGFAAALNPAWRVAAEPTPGAYVHKPTMQSWNHQMPSSPRATFGRTRRELFSSKELVTSTPRSPRATVGARPHRASMPASCAAACH